MAITNVLIIPRRFADTSVKTEYISPSNTITIIDKFTATNIGTTPAIVNVNIPANGEIVKDSNKVTSGRKIAPGEVYTFPELVGQILGPNGYISTNANLANSVVLSAAGRQVV